MRNFANIGNVYSLFFLLVHFFSFFFCVTCFTTNDNNICLNSKSLLIPLTCTKLFFTPARHRETPISIHSEKFLFPDAHVNIIISLLAYGKHSSLIFLLCSCTNRKDAHIVHFESVRNFQPIYVQQTNKQT